MISIGDVEAARERISSFVTKTPLEKSRTLSTLLGTNVYLKLELFQKTGSFKPRGAFNQILQLTGLARDRGVVAVSGGNFAQGVAYAGNSLNTKAVICMPAYTPSNYVEATKSYGADVMLAPDFPWRKPTRPRDMPSFTLGTTLIRWLATARSGLRSLRNCRKSRISSSASVAAD